MSTGNKDSAAYAGMMLETLLRMVPVLKEIIAASGKINNSDDPSVLLCAVRSCRKDLDRINQRYITTLQRFRNEACHGSASFGGESFMDFLSAVEGVTRRVTTRTGPDKAFTDFVDDIRREVNGGAPRVRVQPTRTDAPRQRPEESYTYGRAPVRTMPPRPYLYKLVTSRQVTQEKTVSSDGQTQTKVPVGSDHQTQTEVRDLEEASTQTIHARPVLSRQTVDTAMCDLLRQILKTPQKPPAVLTGSCIVCGESVAHTHWACTRGGTETPKYTCRELVAQATAEAVTKGTKKPRKTRKVYLTRTAVTWLHSQME
ncbi:hypothetical protein J8273_7654 [Carpediemonas membranifera]|uniref:Uncharacterized protein n=1 Tax=Carpediemonas membranifera TaxID=201153 RepID=A0A8J6E043_9EUKA|nr:hypothetical protein J8273_7654 [Carpediemonas membranifera]|eukprot:KAG9391286.1 hypothetical protein J8273_7654 [Carpediemonas membranifera]